MSQPSATDLTHLRHAIRLSEDARRCGDMPFGAVLVAPDGAVLAAAQNSIVTDRNLTAHAEINALRTASARCSAQQIAAATMYASGEPCPMCSGAMVRFGLRRLLFGIRASVAMTYLPATAGVIAASVACRDILKLAAAPVEVQGPVIEEEARAPFESYAARGAGTV